MSVAAILLAAGQSQRMGAFKPLLRFGNKTVIESCVDYLLQGGIENVVVVVGHRAAEIKKALAELPVRIAVNPDRQSEMAASIACGVSALPAECEATLITPADYPAVPAGIVKSLIEAWRTSSAKLVVPDHLGRGGHPVLIDLRLRDQLLQLDPQRGLRGLFEAQREQMMRIPVDSPFIARDMDTWEDYRQLHLDVFGSEPLMPT
jgi:molybdenum cofactor cytidylyltransferase